MQNKPKSVLEVEPPNELVFKGWSFFISSSAFFKFLLLIRNRNYWANGVNFIILKVACFITSFIKSSCYWYSISKAVIFSSHRTFSLLACQQFTPPQSTSSYEFSINSCQAFCDIILIVVLPIAYNSWPLRIFALSHWLPSKKLFRWWKLEKYFE